MLAAMVSAGRQKQSTHYQPQHQLNMLVEEEDDELTETLTSECHHNPHHQQRAIPIVISELTDSDVELEGPGTTHSPHHHTAPNAMALRFPVIEEDLRGTDHSSVPTVALLRNRPTTNSSPMMMDAGQVVELLADPGRSCSPTPPLSMALSTIMVNGQQVPADATNCDCTQLAWAALRPSTMLSRRRRKLIKQLRLQRKQLAAATAAATAKGQQPPPPSPAAADDDSYIKAAPSPPTSLTIPQNGDTLLLPSPSQESSNTISTDSGIASSLCVSECSSRSGSMASTIGSVGGGNGAGKLPPMQMPMAGGNPKRGGRSGSIERGRKALGLLLGSVVKRMMFMDGGNSKGAATIAAATTANKQQKNDGQYSPRWRGDDTGEALLPHSHPSSKSNGIAAKDLDAVAASLLEASTIPISNGIGQKLTPKSTSTPTTPTAIANGPLSSNLQTDRLLDTNKALNGPFSSSNRPSVTNKRPLQNIAGRLANMPRFHFPGGRPLSKAENDATLERVRQHFTSHHPNNGQLPPSSFDEVCRRMGFALYAKRAVYEACLRLSGVPLKEGGVEPPVTFQQFNTYWQRMTAKAHDEAARFIFTLASARPPVNDQSKGSSSDYVTKEGFFPMMMDMIHTHPGLHFLKEAPQFHIKYCEMVIVRIFWCVNRSWSGKITAEELRRSNFLETLHFVEQVTDINKVTDYFSYEAFYVSYCKFWEIDQDHDMVISRADMRQHGNGALTDRIIDRIFSSAVLRVPPEHRQQYSKNGPATTTPIDTIGFEDFVAFLLAEEDKRHPTAIEYWFRCIDLDGDGVISLFEMQHFYEAIESKLLAKNMETLALNDVICNLLDSVSPTNQNYITRSDLKRCGLAHRFFNTFVNVYKYLEQESSEGERASVKTAGDREMSDWESFCAVEYELLMGEADNGGGDFFAEDSIDVVLDDDEDVEHEGTADDYGGGGGSGPFDRRQQQQQNGTIPGNKTVSVTSA